MKVESICVYCGSAVGDDPIFTEAAERFGAVLAQSGIRLVYGGGSIGLMGVLARSALRHGGQVLGIIPGFLKDRELALGEVSKMIVTDDMHARKRAMFEHSHAFVALPGGIGTLEETVEMMTWIRLGQHRKPIVLANLQRFWDPLIVLLRHMTAAGFLNGSGNHDDPYQVVGEIDEVLPMLLRAAEPVPPRLDAIVRDAGLF